MKFIKENKRNIAIFILISVLFLLLRFFMIEHRIGFGWDQERDAYEISKLVVDHKLTLIGPRVVNVHGFFLAPYYTYILLPFYIMSNLHPYGAVYFLFFISLLFIATSLFVIRKIWGTQVAVFFILLWAVNPILIGYDMTAWNVSLVPTLTLLTFFLLYRAYSSNKLYDWLLLGSILALGINFHFQFIFVIIISLSFVVVSYAEKRYDIKNVLLSFLSGAAVFLPLFLFDLRHDFLNTKLFFQFFLNNPEASVKDYSSWIEVINNTFLPFTIIKHPLLIIAFYIGVSALTYLMIKTHKGFQKYLYISFLVTIISTPIFFLVYAKRPSEYYFIFLYVLCYLVIIQSFVCFKRTFILSICIVVMILANIPQYRLLLQPNQYSLFYKDQAIKYVQKKVTENPSNIGIRTDPGQDNGFLYLLYYYKIEQYPDPSYPMIEIVIPPEEGSKVFGDIGVLIH